MRQDDGQDVLREGRGRSAKKRAAKAIEHLAQQLTEMAETELTKLPIKQELAEEIDIARRTKGHGSKKRQVKHLAGFLRKHEEAREAIEAALAGQAVAQRQENLVFHHLEEIRDRLCAAATYDATLKELLNSHPQIDKRKLARLASAVHEHGDKKAAREIFRLLRKTLNDNT